MNDPKSLPEHASRRDDVANLYNIDDADVRAELDRIARLAARLCGTPIGVVSLVLDERLVYLGRAGLTELEGPREHSFCAHAMYQVGCMTVPDALADPRFSRNPLVCDAPGIRFYAGEPLVANNGAPLGSLCVLDSVPRETLTEDQIDGLRTLASAAMAHLEKWRTAHDWSHQSEGSQRELDRLNRRFDALAEALPQLVWSTPHDGLSDYFNGHWCRFTGAPASASYGNGWLDFLHPDDVGPAGEA